MKSTATFKSLMVSGLLLLVGASVASAQADYASASSPVTQAGRTYRLEFPENLGGYTERNGISVDASNNLINIAETGRKGGSFTYDVNIPTGTPLGSVITIMGSGMPLWHVTVADILGNAESNDPVTMRPLDEVHTGTGVGNNPNAISQPAGANTGTATTSSVTGSGIDKMQPRMDVYPNPTTEFITIVTEGEVLWGIAEVIDPTGKKVLEIPTGSGGQDSGISQLTLNVSQLKAGMYFVRVRIANDYMTKRFFVSK